MKKTLNVVRYALVSLFSFLFIGSALADAGDIININVFQDGTSISQDQQTLASETVKIPQDAWLTIGQPSGGNKSVSGNTGFNLNSQSVVTLSGSVTATIHSEQGANWAYWNKSDTPSPADPQYAYLTCWGSNRDRTCIVGSFKLENVPFDNYDVILYFQGGTAMSSSTRGNITVEGSAPAGFDPIRVTSGNSNFTSTHYYRPDANGVLSVDTGLSGSEVDQDLNSDVITQASLWGQRAQAKAAYNVNATIVKGCSGTFEIHYWARTAGIAAVQIIDCAKASVEITVDGTAVKVSDINAKLASVDVGDPVKVTLTEAETLEFDEPFKCAKCKVVYDGALKLLGNEVPEYFEKGKFDFRGVTSLDYAWLPVGTGMAINFKQDSGKLGDTDEALIPGLTIYGNTWNNVGTSGSLDAKMFGSDGSTVLADTMAVSYNGGSYQWTNATTPYLKGYLDDSNISFITTVPFSYYDVYIICATDTANAKFSYKTINGVNYSANDNGEAVAGSTAAWGASQQSTPILGTNVMRLSGLTTQKFEITNSPKVSGAVRGCIAAIVIVKAEPPAETVTATINGDTDWSKISWSATPTAKTPVELTINGSAKLTVDAEVVAMKVKLIGDNTAAQTIAIEGTPANINAFLNKVTATADFAGKFDYRYDVKNGFTADDALLNTIKNATGNTTYTFIGSGENGVTFGSSSSTWNGTLSSHIVLNGGKHAIYWSNGNALFGTGASVDNPTLLLENNATMDFYGHDITGWSAYADDDNARLAGVIRVNNGSTLNMHRQGNGTVYYNQTFCIEGGAKITTDINGTDARMGGAKIVVPAQDAAGDPAEIVCLSTGSGSLFFGKDIPKGAEFSIGANAKLKITGAVESLNGGNNQVAGGGDYPLKKTGEGVLEVTGNILAPVNVESGSLALGGSVRSIMFVDDATLTSINTISLKDFSVASGKTLLLDATAGDIAITKAPTNNGTIKIVGGNVAFMPDTNVGTIVEEGGKAIYGYIVNINDCGKFTIPADKTAESIRLFDAAGNVVPFTDNKDGTVSYEWVVTGGVCWWDYEFEGNDNNDGTDGTRLSWDGGHPRSGAEYTEDGELYISSVPWRGGVNWPEKATFVMYGTMVGTDKTYQIGFGSTYQGQQPYNTIFLATDTVSENTVNLCICQAKDAPTLLCQMTVPNAQTAKHLYAFTLKTVDAKTVVDIYLDGELLQSYPFDSQIVLGSGFQIGSGHGGTCAGYERTAAEDEAVLDFLRVYKEDLSAEAHQKYAVLYPYVSPNGSYQRTVTADADWSATDAWTKEGTEPAETADEPAAGATVKLAIDNDDATTTIAINLADDVTYEAIQINGDDVKFVLAEGEEFGGIAKSTGRVTANANITFAYDAFSMAGAPLTVKQGKTVTFDLSMVDMAQYFSTQTYDLTGYLTLEDDAEVTFIVPEDLHGREASAAIDPITQHYVLTVTAPDYAFVYENGKWTWGTQVVDEDTINAHPEVLRSIKSDLEMALGAYNYSVEDGVTLKPMTDTATSTVTINAGGTLDVNGVVDTALKVVLNGGSLVNNGTTIGTGNKQYDSITQTAASTIGGSGDFGYILSGWGANTLDLGGATLTKQDDNTFSLCNTTVQNGTLKIAAGTLAIASAVTIEDTATIEGVEGATLSNGASISDFTLTGAFTLAGAGTFGTITLDDAALDIATVRGLTVAGEGTIKATITAAEMATGSVTVFTKAADAMISTVTLVDESGEALTGCTADYDEDGNYIANFTVAVVIPTIDGTSVTVAAKETNVSSEIIPVEVKDDKAVIPYGWHLIVTYTPPAGKLFKDGTSEIEYNFDNVTVDPDVNSQIKDDDRVIVSALAKIEKTDDTAYYLTLAAAVDAVGFIMEEDETNVKIELLGNCAGEGVVEIDVSNYLEYTLTIDFGAFTYTGDIELAGGNLTFVNGTLNGKFVAGENIGEGTITKDDNFTADAPEGYEWKKGVLTAIYPEAQVEPVTPAPEGLDFAFKYTAANEAPLYNASVASFILTANKAIPAGAIKIGGKFEAMGWNIYDLPSDITEGGSFTVVEGITWAEVKAIEPFTCGAASIALTEDTEVTITLKLDDKVIDTQTVTLKAAQAWPAEWPADVDDDVKNAFGAWKTSYGVTDFNGKEAAFLLNVAPGDEKSLVIESITVSGTTATVVISAGNIDLEEINGKLFVEAGDTLDTMADKALTFTYGEDGKATGSINAKFIKAKIGFKLPPTE